MGWDVNSVPYGTYVKPDMAPGKSETDCQSCPQGNETWDYTPYSFKGLRLLLETEQEFSVVKFSYTLSKISPEVVSGFHP